VTVIDFVLAEVVLLNRDGVFVGFVGGLQRSRAAEIPDNLLRPQMPGRSFRAGRYESFIGECACNLKRRLS